ncbi:MAG: isopeptide-forming domain-containing fimbrial protein [Anaerovoracaceae bacterium]|jgi:fimbrial isopeptide formation D2 family protein/uncharacterized repeat protein (TIGR01451 family)
MKNVTSLRLLVRTAAFLSILAALIFAYSPAYASSFNELAQEASRHTDIREGGSDESYFKNGSSGNGYSSWAEGKSRAFIVPPEYSSRLESDYNADSYPKTTVTASGSVTEDVHCSWQAAAVVGSEDGQDIDTWMRAENFYIFRLDHSADGCGVHLVYSNLYHYDPEDRNALKKGHAGYVPVNMTVTVKDFTKKVWYPGIDPAKRRSYTEDPYIAFGRSINGLPTIDLFNVGTVQVEYRYTYASGEEKGKPYVLKTNTTYNDIDAYQSIGVQEEKASFFVSRDTNLACAASGGFQYFYGNTPKSVIPDQHPELAFGMTLRSDTETILYASPMKQKGALNLGEPNGAWTHFGASSYMMIRPSTPDPIKTVSDSDRVAASIDGKNVTFKEGEDAETLVNGIGSPKSSFTYSVDQFVPGGLAEAWYYTRFAFEDPVSPLLTIEKVEVLQDQTDRTDWFTIRTENNLVTAEAKPDILKHQEFYGPGGHTVRLRITARLRRDLTRKDLREAGVLTEGEEAIRLENTASTILEDRGASENKRSSAKPTITFIRIPPVDDPMKRVSDSDEKDTEGNTVSYFDNEPFTYDIAQNVREDAIHFDQFKITDTVDSCLHVRDQKEIRVLDETGKDQSARFRVSVQKADAPTGAAKSPAQTVVSCEALADELKNESFYGHTYHLTFPCDVKSQEKHGSAGICSDWWEKEGHFNKGKSELSYRNKAVTTIDGGDPAAPSASVKAAANTKGNAITKETNEVTTKIALPTLPEGSGEPGLVITKEADRYEYQVGSPVHYKLRVKNASPDKTCAANYVTVSDKLPEGLEIVPETLKFSGLDPSLKDPEGKERSASLKASQDKRSLLFQARFLAKGETVLIEFDTKPLRSVNGTHVTNTSSAASEGVPEKTDREIIYVNSPKLDVRKSLEDGSGPESTVTCKKGDVLNYRIEVRNRNKGTFARDIVITDTISEKGSEEAAAVLDLNSIVIKDMNGKTLTRAEDAASMAAGKGDYLVEEQKELSAGGKTGFRITFRNGNLGYSENTEIPPVTLKDGQEAENPEAAENKSYSYTKNYKGLDLSKGYIILYSLTVTADDPEGHTIRNAAVASPGKDTNGNDIPDDPDIPSGKGEGNATVHLTEHGALRISKTIRESSFQKGSRLHYTIELSGGRTVIDPVLIDQVKEGSAELDKDTLKIERIDSNGNAKDVTKEFKIEPKKSGYQISVKDPDSSHFRLKKGEILRVTYVMTAKSDTSRIRNLAKAKDNKDPNWNSAEAEISAEENTPVVKETPEKPSTHKNTKGPKTGDAAGGLGLYLITLITAAVLVMLLRIRARK